MTVKLPPPPRFEVRCRELVTEARSRPAAERELDRLLYTALWHWLDTGDSPWRGAVDRYAGYRRLVDGVEADPLDPFGLRYDLTHKRENEDPTSMLCVSMTRYCQLRCSYCKFRWWIENEIPQDALSGAVQLLFTSRSEHLHLDFVGGEPLLFASRVLDALDEAREMERETGKSLQTTVVTNAITLVPELADQLAERDVRVLVSLDGGSERMARYRMAKPGALDEDLHAVVARHLGYLVREGHRHQAVMTVPPQAAGEVAEDFGRIVDLGVDSIQVQYAIGWPWELHEQQQFLDGMQRLIEEWVVPGHVVLDNLARREPILLDGTPTVEPDGTLILGSDCMLENEHVKDPLYTLGRVPGAGPLDAIGGTAFHTLYMLTRQYGDKRDRDRLIIRDNVRMGYALERLLERYR